MIDNTKLEVGDEKFSDVMERSYTNSTESSQRRSLVRSISQKVTNHYHHNKKSWLKNTILALVILGLLASIGVLSWKFFQTKKEYAELASGFIHLETMYKCLKGLVDYEPNCQAQRPVLAMLEAHCSCQCYRELNNS